MERPTCKTCPYFYSSEDEVSGSCMRYPPVLIEPPIHFNDHAWDWPVIESNDFCGEHPDFPAYIASLKTSPTTLPS